jgi:septal ring factor EnvC (AmiA/AmiB activator)
MCRSFTRGSRYNANTRPTLALSEHHAARNLEVVTSIKDSSDSIARLKPAAQAGAYLFQDLNNNHRGESLMVKKRKGQTTKALENQTSSSQGGFDSRTPLEDEIEQLESQFTSLEFELYQNQVDIVQLRIKLMTIMMSCKAAALPLQQSSQEIVLDTPCHARKKQVRFVPHHTCRIIPACNKGRLLNRR